MCLRVVIVGIFWADIYSIFADNWWYHSLMWLLLLFQMDVVRASERRVPRRDLKEIGLLRLTDDLAHGRNWHEQKTVY